MSTLKYKFYFRVDFPFNSRDSRINCVNNCTELRSELFIGAVGAVCAMNSSCCSSHPHDAL